jgi:hypothetical protein
MGQPYWRALTVQVDTITKANCTAQVIPSAHIIAEEDLRQQAMKELEEKGTCVCRERWQDHRNVPDMVRDFGLAYRDTDNDGREVYCPVCLKCRGGEGREVIKVYASPSASRKAIGRHVATQRHKLNYLSRRQKGVMILQGRGIRELKRAVRNWQRRGKERKCR